MSSSSNMRRRGNGKGLTFLERALRSETDECILWPFYCMKNGYGQLGTHDGMMLAHRYVCIRAHGDAPFEGAQAAHSCGNRSCVNTRHLRWATAAENEADKRAHGTWHTRMGGAKLNEDAVLRIRAMAAEGLSRKEIAREMGKPVRTIGHVVSGQTWKHVVRARS